METWYHKIQRDPMRVDILVEPTQSRELYYLALLDRMDSAAKFLITKDIVDLISGPGFAKNLPLLAKAGRLRLPFDPLVVEFEPPHRGGRWFICLRQHDETQRIFTTDAIYMHNHDKTMLLSEPGSVALVMNEAIEAMNFDDKSAGQAVAGAMMMAIVAHVTKGVAKERVVPDAKLNKARAKRKKAPVPEYTTMRIGQVYDRSGNPVSMTDAGGPRKIHWRAAHTRRQRYGVGLSQTKIVEIDALLVNYNPGDEKPELPKRRVKL
jgi:hypothetical protein